MASPRTHGFPRPLHSIYVLLFLLHLASDKMNLEPHAVWTTARVVVDCRQPRPPASLRPNDRHRPTSSVDSYPCSICALARVCVRRARTPHVCFVYTVNCTTALTVCVRACVHRTGLPNKACPSLRDLATAPARGITQSRTNLIREPCTGFYMRRIVSDMIEAHSLVATKSYLCSRLGANSYLCSQLVMIL